MAGTSSGEKRQEEVARPDRLMARVCHVNTGSTWCAQWIAFGREFHRWDKSIEVDCESSGW